MVYGYWKTGIHNQQAVFHLYFRKRPFSGGFAIAAGLQPAVNTLQAFRFSPSDLTYLKTYFEPAFLDFLGNFAFSCDVDAIPEGSLVFPNEPLIRVKGPIWQGQMLESMLLNRINFETLIATKAARICLAAYPDPVVEFGMRRAQGPDGALSASRAAFIGGCRSTSHVLAGKQFQIPVKGTQAHSWIMAFDTEEQAFEAFAKAYPQGSILLVDTYDSLQGTRHAVQVAKKLKWPLEGIRLDSGDLLRLSIACRKILDEAGFTKAVIMASNELDERIIASLKARGAPIHMWGVGTHLVTAKDQPALDGIYKLCAIQSNDGTWHNKAKRSDQREKATLPGILQVARRQEGPYYTGDHVYDELAIDRPEGKPVLVPIFRLGHFVGTTLSLNEIQKQAQTELARLPEAIKRLDQPETYPVAMDLGQP
ncbi:MAG: hypothetical protein RL235_314 [Chlamydiota bacterium]